jgi:hypothetical protein
MEGPAVRSGRSPVVMTWYQLPCYFEIQAKLGSLTRITSNLALMGNDGDLDMLAICLS